MSWRDLAHSLFEAQQQVGTKRESGTQFWDKPVFNWPIGVHDFPDKQRPLYGARGQAGGAGLNTPCVLLGTLTEIPCDLAVQMISFKIFSPTSVAFENPHGWFPAYAHIWTPQATPDPVAILPPTYPGQVRPFLRPRPRVSASGRGVVVSGQYATGTIQSESTVAPRFAQETRGGNLVAYGPGFTAGASAPWPVNRDVYFDPPLIVPGDQFVGVCALNEASTGGGALVIDVEFLFREISP